MIEFTDENIEWLSKLITDGTTRTQDEGKIIKLNHLKEKVESLGEFKFKIGITVQELTEINNVILDLEKLTSSYTNMFDISALEEYDKLKKQFAGKLQYLSTFKDLLCDESAHMEEVLKKEIKVTLSLRIKEEEGVSFTQADKMVEKDKRYTVLRDQVNHIERIANRVKTKYLFYMQLWQMIFQNVSTASKEKYTTNNNGD